MEEIGKIIEGGIFIDDRGPLRFVNEFNFKDVKRFYQVENHERGFIRAWHGHKKEGKYVYVARGSAWIGLVDMDEVHNDRYILSDKKPQILYIPPGNYNGFQTLEDDTIIMFFSTTTTEESKGDDYRVPYNTFPIFNKEYR
jgi:dTDP-4-dehydrorhamnose 3,5-epimerase